MEHLQEWEILQEKLKNIPANQVIKSLFAYAVNSNLSVAVWRLSNQSKKHLVIDFSGQVKRVKADLEESDQGFIINPFLSQDGHQAIFIKNDLYYCEKENQINISPTVNISQNKVFEIEKMSSFLNDDFVSKYHLNKNDYYNETRKEDFVKIVQKAVAKIKKSEFEKVVPSKIKKKKLPELFDVIDTFGLLCEHYPNALVSVTSIPEIGTWVGATPEKIISVDKNKIFSTTALAGTQLVDTDTDLMEVAWKQKEIEEQAMVSRYIINCFKKIRLREFTEQGPMTSKAGALAHLKTDFFVDMTATNFPQLGSVMLELLHPTSAVCGMPKLQAVNFLNENETHQREFFSGFLGPVNISEETHLFVNIRCMQLLTSEALLYAGAGVTRYSDPVKEWEETELKCDTMLKFLV